jgi:integrase
MNGWIERTRSGAYRARMRLNDGRKVTLDTFATEGEATAVLEAAIAELREADPDTLTVGSWLRQHIAERDAAKEIVDVKGQRQIVELHVVADAMGRMLLRSLRRWHVTEWIRRLARKQLSRARILKCLVLLRGALQAALDRRLVRENVARDVTVPKEKRTTEPWTFLAPDEQSRLIGAIDGPERWLVAFAMGTGLRGGELAALRIADVVAHGARPRVTVRYGAPPAQPTKTGTIREVPLFGIGAQAWAEWSALLPGFCSVNPLGLAFPRVRGSYRDPDHLIRWEVWSAALRDAGITRPVRFYDATRHTCASSLVSGFWGRPWTLLEVQKVLGHRSSITVTERYAHLAESAIHEAARGTNPAPLVPHAPRRGNGEKRMISGGAADGDRTRDLRFTNAQQEPRNHSRNLQNGAIVGHAVAVLRAIADGLTVEAVAERLASAVLDAAADAMATAAEAAS